MSEITKEQWDELNAKYEQLKRNEEMYRVAIGLTDHTITVVDIKEHTLSQIYNEGDWTGITNTMENAPESIIETGIIHPDDCEGYRKFYQDIYAGVPKGEFTMRVMEAHRGWVWFTMYYQTIFDKDGTPLRAICFSDDITIQKRAEEKYSQFKNAVSTNADFVWEVNLTTDALVSVEQRQGSMPFATDNMTYSVLSEFAGSQVKDPLYREMVASFFKRDKLLESYKKAKREITLDHPFDYEDGRGIRWLHTTAYMIANVQEEVILILCSIDITDIHKEQENLVNKAEFDALTGLSNRATTQSNVSYTLSFNNNAVHGLLMIDTDDFKKYNDTYGHAYGDQVLQLVAKVLKKSFRSADIVGRFGGDEFLVMLKDVPSLEIVLSLANQLNINMKNACIEEKLPEEVTLSIGATVSKETDTFESIFLRADKALYMSKEKGKNQVSFF